MVAAASRQLFLTELAMLLFTAAFGMACAWWLGQRLIVRPAQAILREANELAVGNLAARVEVGPAYRGELGHLARTFNRMADSLRNIGWLHFEHLRDRHPQHGWGGPDFLMTVYVGRADDPRARHQPVRDQAGVCRE